MKTIAWAAVIALFTVIALIGALSPSSFVPDPPAAGCPAQPPPWQTADCGQTR